MRSVLGVGQGNLHSIGTAVGVRVTVRLRLWIGLRISVSRD